MSATAKPARLVCPCGASWEPRDVVLYNAHVRRCDDYAKATRPREQVRGPLDDAPRFTAYQWRRMRERWRSQDIDQALWDREIRPALDVWTNEGGKP